VGPKSAYSLIATVGVQGICEAIIYDRQDVLKSAPGIGAKVAAKIILELQDKIKNISITQQIVKSSDSNSIYGEVVEACVGLGFKDKDVMQILKTNAQVQEVKNSSELLKIVLKELSK
jgi:Holliday junction DNA helicase RuvA